MPFEEFAIIIASLKRKLFYIAGVFIAGAIFSFQYMGYVIKKIEDHFSLSPPDQLNATKQLIEISRNLSLISKDVNNSIIAQNLTKFSVELINISQNLNLREPKFVTLTPLEVPMLEFKMSLIFGVLLATPLIIYYAYKELKGRLPNVISINKSLIISVIIASIVLFLLGVGYSYFIMIPLFQDYVNQETLNIGAIQNYSVYEFIYFVVMTSIIIGFAFELPLIMTLVVRFGIISRQTLSYYRRHAYIILLVVAAWITPGPDIFSQIMVVVPFVVLYEISLLVIRFTGK
ncbi:MAG: twin-arginine translocase subunit TatC [Candidatus Methanoperedens sp.]|nr:twin-arginine translocase subunit TatC [Candidatus Methanoperedens sp.]MCZ7370877.1 twin-arginine translocase subunit TatC [Candidatus Methanoperedens sp.]